METICPHCKKPIYDDEALLCLYCGESLNRAIGVFGGARGNPGRLIFIVLTVLVLIGFLMVVIF